MKRREAHIVLSRPPLARFGFQPGVAPHTGHPGVRSLQNRSKYGGTGARRVAIATGSVATGPPWRDPQRPARQRQPQTPREPTGPWEGLVEILWSTRVRLGRLRCQPGEWRAVDLRWHLLGGSLLARRHRAASGGAGGTYGVEECGWVCTRSRGAIESLGAVWGDPAWVQVGRPPRWWRGWGLARGGWRGAGLVC